MGVHRAALATAAMRLLATLLLLCAYVTGKLVFESTVLVGSDTKARFDTRATAWPVDNGDAMVLAVANSTTFQSVDGGRSWQRSQGHWAQVPGLAVQVSPTVKMATIGSGVPSGYLPAPLPGPFTTKSRATVTIDPTKRTFNYSMSTDPAHQTTWEAPPYPVVLFSLSSGGITTLPNGKILATPWVWYSNHALPKPLQCCNGSVVAYVSADGGRSFQFVSEIASKSTVNKLWPSQEGPNENDVTTLKDGSVLCVIRKDGGDGVPNHKHVSFFFATSHDEGISWILREAPPAVLSARPRMTSLPGGAILIAGGRPALNLWVNEKGDAESWTTVDIPTEHNKLISDPTLQFCPEFLHANASLGWEESSCYTAVVALSPTVGLVCYERQGAASGGMSKKPPPACKPAFSSIFCMRVRVSGVSSVG